MSTFSGKLHWSALQTTLSRFFNGFTKIIYPYTVLCNYIDRIGFLRECRLGHVLTLHDSDEDIILNQIYEEKIFRNLNFEESKSDFQKFYI